MNLYISYQRFIRWWRWTI